MVRNLEILLRADGLDALANRHIWADGGAVRDEFGMREVRPVAVLRANVVRARTDDRHTADGCQGQGVRVVFEQGDGLACRPKRRLLMLLAPDAPRTPALLRLRKQIHAALDGQNVAHRVVQHGFVELAGAHRVNRRIVEAEGSHHHVVACLGSQHGRFGHVRRDVLGAQKRMAVVPVGDAEAVKARVAAQNRLHALLVGGEGRAVDGTIRRHDRCAPCPERLLERRQERLAQAAVRHFRVTGIARADRLAVADVVLGARQNVFAVGQIVALIAAHDRFA